MCGIAGFASTRDPADRALLGDMIATLAHRGPDAFGLHVDRTAGLAHARLAIIDVGGGQQPMSNEDGSLWITFNGEIFNYVELREDLIRRGHRFQTRSDTEVILHLYEDEGIDAVLKLNGQWAFAIWDARKRRLFLSRDRFGVRPLFYTTTPDRLAFASEIKALFADPRCPREIDPIGIDNAMTFWAPVPSRTVFKNVHELPPAHSLTWQDGRMEILSHWRPRFPASGDSSASEDELVERLRSTLEDSVRIRLRSDVPVAAYLSGGLDSTVIAALARRSSDRPLSTFSIVFDEGEFDERAHQRVAVGDRLATHREMRCTARDIARVFPDVVCHAERPVPRTAPAPMFLLSKLVRDSGFKVALSGEGADEVLGGYSLFKEAKIRRYMAGAPLSRRRPMLLRRLYPYLPDLQRQTPRYLEAFFHVKADDLASPFFSHLPRWVAGSRLRLLFSDAARPSINGYDAFADLSRWLPDDYPSWDPFCQSQYLEQVVLFPGYILSSQGDRMAMAHGVETRHPFLDPALVDFAAALPATLKMKVLTEKYLLKQAARNLVPDAVWQRAKQPYRAPDGCVFFSKDRPDYVDDLLSAGQVRRDGLFKPEAVERLVRKFREGRATSNTDNLGLLTVLSTQLLVDRFVNNVERVSHGAADPRIAELHHR